VKTATAPRRRVGLGFRLGLVAAAVLALPAGLYGTALSPLTVWVVGALAAAVGAVGTARRARWGLLLLVIGAALLLGSAAYFVLGLIQPDGPASGGGSNVAP
jgi:hypothetical protein